jgi:hypothetical protein
MTIYEVLEQLPYKRRVYIKWKFGLWFQQEKQLTEDEVMNQLKVKTLNSYKKYEKSEEYRHIVSLYLQTKAAQDLLDMYDAVAMKVRDNPEPKHIEMMLKLQKEIKAYKREAEGYFTAVENEEEDDGLEL